RGRRLGARFGRRGLRRGQNGRQVVRHLELGTHDGSEPPSPSPWRRGPRTPAVATPSPQASSGAAGTVFDARTNSRSEISNLRSKISNLRFEISGLAPAA